MVILPSIDSSTTIWSLVSLLVVSHVALVFPIRGYQYAYHWQQIWFWNLTKIQLRPPLMLRWNLTSAMIYSYLRFPITSLLILCLYIRTMMVNVDSSWSFKWWSHGDFLCCWSTTMEDVVAFVVISRRHNVRWSEWSRAVNQNLILSKLVKVSTKKKEPLLLYYWRSFCGSSARPQSSQTTRTIVQGAARPYSSSKTEVWASIFCVRRKGKCWHVSRKRDWCLFWLGGFCSLCFSSDLSSASYTTHPATRNAKRKTTIACLKCNDTKQLQLE
jgi:hypothetical protein